MVVLLGETFRHHTEEENEIVTVRIKPSLSTVQTLAWTSVITRYAQTYWTLELNRST